MLEKSLNKLNKLLILASFIFFIQALWSTVVAEQLNISDYQPAVKCGTLPIGPIVSKSTSHVEVSGESLHVKYPDGYVQEVSRRYTAISKSDCWVEYYIVVGKGAAVNSVSNFAESMKATGFSYYFFEQLAEFVLQNTDYKTCPDKGTNAITAGKSQQEGSRIALKCNADAFSSLDRKGFVGAYYVPQLLANTYSPTESIHGFVVVDKKLIILTGK
jgi:hypothetical protein